jgi:hypothetical protein
LYSSRSTSRSSRRQRSNDGSSTGQEHMQLLKATR